MLTPPLQWSPKRCSSAVFRVGSSTPSTLSLRSLFLNATRAKDESGKAGRDGKVLRMVIFGKPGAGKGTLSARLVKKYDIMSLSTGDILRQNIHERTEVGAMAEEIVKRGELVSDDMMLKILTNKLDTLHNQPWILDGFPRTLRQGKMLDEHLQTKSIPLTLVVNLDVPDEVILARISHRYVHLPSGRVYNTSYHKPKVPGSDDVTGEPLTKRPDDNPETFALRLNKFYEATSPLLDYYASRPPTGTKLVTLKGSTSDEVWPRLDSVIRQAFPSLPERTEPKKRHSLTDGIISGEERQKQADPILPVL